MIMLTRRESNRIDTSILKSVYHDTIRKNQVQNALGILWFKRAAIENMTFGKWSVADACTVTGNNHARELQAGNEVAGIFKHTPCTDANTYSFRSCVANRVDILLWNCLMIAAQQRSIHIKSNQANTFHVDSSSFA